MDEITSLRVAVQGCAHGELDLIYSTIMQMQNRFEDRRAVDLLICCGDFQAVRNEPDLECMACPPKYRAMRDFWSYYSGLQFAPVLTIVIGGNHEASNYMQELPYGGWLAPNIYYLGTSGVVRYRGLRIGGYSGIYKRYDWNSGYHEVSPYSSDALHSVNHTRQFDLWRLSHLSQPLDALLSHDWPAGVSAFGDQAGLLRAKRHFADDIARGELGNAHALQLMRELQPRYWFAGHMHCNFAAVVPHESEGGGQSIAHKHASAPPAHAHAHGHVHGLVPSQVAGTGAGSSSGNGTDVGVPVTTVPSPPALITRFLATDKPLPGRVFLQVVDIPVQQHQAQTKDTSAVDSVGLEFDAEWMAVVARTHTLVPIGPRAPPLPPAHPVTAQEMHAVMTRLAAAFGEAGSRNAGAEGAPATIPRVPIPLNFVPTVPWAPPPASLARGPREWYRPGPAPSAQGNPQMDALLSAMGVPHAHTLPWGAACPCPTSSSNSASMTRWGAATESPAQTAGEQHGDPSEIDLDDLS